MDDNEKEHYACEDKAHNHPGKMVAAAGSSDDDNEAEPSSLLQQLIRSLSTLTVFKIWRCM